MQRNPDVVGISVLFALTVSEVFKICAEIKKRTPQTPILLGGQHPSGAPIDCMKRPYVDYIITGEAELTMLRFMDALNGKIKFEEVPNLYFKDQNSNIINNIL